METKEITKALALERHYLGSKVFRNCYIDNFECDILEVNQSGFTTEYEVKISRSDFKNDRKKLDLSRNVLKDDLIQLGNRTNYFYYVVPENLLSVDEIPEYAGLIYVKQKQESKRYTMLMFERIKKAPKLHKNKIQTETYIEILEKIYLKFMSNSKF